MPGWFSDKSLPLGLMPGRWWNIGSFHRGMWRASAFARSKKEELRPFPGNLDMNHTNKRPVVVSRSFLMSLAVHALFVGGMFLCSADAPRAADPIVVTLLTPETEGGGGGGSHPWKQVKARRPHLRAGVVRTAQAPRPVLTTVREQIIPPPVVAAPSREAVAVPAPAEPQKAALPLSPQPSSEGTLHGEGSGTGIGSGTGSGVGAGSGSGSGGGSGSGTGDSVGRGQRPAESIETLKEKYRKEHFAYIRDLILQNLEYPPVARQLGWHGALTVSFVVKKTGETEKVRITRSAGYEILDRNVIETIKEVQPFPKPPVKVEIEIPIVYSLK